MVDAVDRLRTLALAGGVGGGGGRGGKAREDDEEEVITLQDMSAHNDFVSLAHAIYEGDVMLIMPPRAKPTSQVSQETRWVGYKP